MSVGVRLRVRVRVRVRRRGSLREQVSVSARVRLRLRLEPRLYRRQRHVTEEREPGVSRLRTGAGGRVVRVHAMAQAGGAEQREQLRAARACSLSSCSAASSVALAALELAILMTKNAGEIDSDTGEEKQSTLRIRRSALCTPVWRPFAGRTCGCWSVPH